MPMITIRFPTKEEEERSHRFTVHRNYLGSIELFLGALYGHGDDQARGVIDAQRILPAFGRIQRRPIADVAELSRLLAISWASETQLRLGDLGGDAFLRYSNAWAPVQAYCAVYMSIHAYLVTAGMGGMIDDHTSTLRTVASHLVDRGLFPHPFDVTCSGCPELGSRQINGTPANANIDDKFENLAGPTFNYFYPRFVKMLETTRDNRLARGRKECLSRSTRKNMPRAEKLALAGRLHATSVFDRGAAGDRPAPAGRVRELRGRVLRRAGPLAAARRTSPQRDPAAHRRQRAEGPAPCRAPRRHLEYAEERAHVDEPSHASPLSTRSVRRSGETRPRSAVAPGSRSGRWSRQASGRTVVSGSAEEMAEAIRSFREAGFTQVDLMLGPGTVEAFDAMAPVLELVRAD